MDLARAFSELKSLPDTALQKELAAPTGAIPGFMVIGELHERKTMRAGAGKAPDDIIKRKSMAEEYMGDIKSQMPMNMMQGMAPTPSQQTMPQQAMPSQGPLPPMSAPSGGIADLPPPPQGYASGGVVSLAGGGGITPEYARQRAVLYGVNPDLFERVIRSEGGFHDIPIQSTARNKAGIREPSYGSLQLLIGGPGTGFGTGLGNAALKAGIDPRKPEDQLRALDFGLQQIVQGGWSPWMGAKKQGITGRMGIGGNSYDPSLLSGVANAAVDPTAQAAAGTAAASDVVATQAAETAGTMAAAENAAGGDPISTYFLMQQIMQQPQVQTPAAPVATRAPEPVDPFQQTAATSHTPGFYRRRYYG